MTNKTTVPKDANIQAEIAHPGMMGDGSEEQNLDEPGNPSARIKKKGNYILDSLGFSGYILAGN